MLTNEPYCKVLPKHLYNIAYSNNNKPIIIGTLFWETELPKMCWHKLSTFKGF